MLLIISKWTIHVLQTVANTLSFFLNEYVWPPSKDRPMTFTPSISNVSWTFPFPVASGFPQVMGESHSTHVSSTFIFMIYIVHSKVCHSSRNNEVVITLVTRWPFSYRVCVVSSSPTVCIRFNFTAAYTAPVFWFFHAAHLPRPLIIPSIRICKKRSSPSLNSCSFSPMA